MLEGAFGRVLTLYLTFQTISYFRQRKQAGMKLSPDQGLASPRLLTYRLDLGDLGDMGDVGMAIFHLFHRQKMYFEKGFTVNGFI
jgi:hypothetical protein